MASVNKVILIGNLGRDPELRYNPEGAAMCAVSIATTSQWKDKASGEKREETEWHRVVFYNRLAEIAGEYLKKGRSVYVEGRLKTRKWQDKETGQDRFSTEVVADQMQMLGGNGGADSGVGSDPAAYGKSTSKSARGRGKGKPVGKPNDSAPEMDDDIPFN